MPENNTGSHWGMAGWCAHLVCGLQLQLLKDLLRLRLGGTHVERECVVGRKISNSVKKKPGTKSGTAKDERGRIRDSLCLEMCNLQSGGGAECVWSG